MGVDGAATETTKTKLPLWRRILVGFLVVLGCVLAPLSVLSVWIKTTALDTDRYVATVAPLSDDPDVEQALATRITNTIMQKVDVESVLADALPSKAAFAAPAIAAGLEQYIHTAALKIVQSDQFDKLWKDANACGHPQIVALLEGKDTKRLGTKDGEITLKLGPIAEKVQSVLDKAGIDVFSGGSGSTPQIVLISSSDLKSAQGITDLLQKLAWVLPVLTILAFAGAIALSGNRRRTILRSGLGIAFGMGILLVVLNLGRHFYLDALPSSVSQPAASAVYDQLLSFLRLALRTAFVPCDHRRHRCVALGLRIARDQDPGGHPVARARSRHRRRAFRARGLGRPLQDRVEGPRDRHRAGDPGGDRRAAHRRR